ncbi:hypothetical protein [Bordetella genomosp. 5]|uniref:Uncharacterized protein n=1 Tax=Bordetella genomosp. 5 TaxID=1395608 RepID=A0A261T9B6_9BORD|nr:hypothetical protein [Bordetella genomosp. 5]OZI45891.1 hypothetical protein CAL25_21985 [Bordetella genomosp. 5]
MRFFSARRLAAAAACATGLGLAAHAYAGAQPCPSLEAALQDVQLASFTDARVMSLALAPITGATAPAAPSVRADTYLGMYEHYLQLTGRSLLAGGVSPH